MSAYTQIISVLEAAASTEHHIRKSADDQLKAWEIEPGFHATLQDVAYDANLDVKIRLLAIITLKNGIDKYWRKTVRVGAVKSIEKAQIRQKLLTVFDEPVDRLATYNSVVISKIARLDYPGDWPDLLNILMQTIQSTFASNLNTADPEIQRVQQRSLNTLYMVVKALCSKMLPASRKVFQQLAPELLQYIGTIFTDRCNHFLHYAQVLMTNAGSGDEQAENALRIGLIALKTLRRVVVYGFIEFWNVKEIANFAEVLLGCLQKFIDLRRTTSPAASGIHKLLSSMVVQIGKVYLNWQSDAAGFIMIPSSIAIVKLYWTILQNGNPNADDPTQEKLLIQSLLLLKTLLKNPAFAHSQSERSPYETLAALHVSSALQTESPPVKRILDTQLFTPEFVKSACELLVGRYMLLTAEDIRMWNEDPEEWFAEQEADRWEYSVRTCAEKVFMDLISTNRSVLQPVLINMFHMVSDTNGPGDFDALLLKDAVYCSVGLAAHDLYDFIDFQQWFEKKLISEATEGGSSYAIIHRRICWLIAQWVPVQPTPAVHPSVYALLISFLAPLHDMVVRLTAVNSLKILTEDFGFETNSFLPYLDGVLEGLACVLTDVGGVDCLGGVVGCLAAVVERLEGVIVPYAPRIMQMVPVLWDTAEGQDLFRASILYILSKLVVSVRTDSMLLHDNVIPILAYSVNVKNPAHIYLLEDGIDLWIAVLQNTTRCTEPLMGLLGYAMEYLEYGTESLKKILRIIEAYVILDVVAVMQSFGTSMFSRLSTMLGSLRPEASNAILHCVDVILQCCYQANCFRAIEDVLVATKVMGKLVDTVKEAKELGLVLVGYLTILGRMTVCDVGTLIRWGDLSALIDVWCEKFDNMGYGKQRKLTAMSLLSLLSTGDQQVLPFAASILTLVSSVLIEVRDMDADQRLLYTYTPRADDDDDDESLDAQRRRQLADLDPVNSIDFTCYVRERLKECRNNIGETVFGSLLVSQGEGLAGLAGLSHR